MTPRPWWISAAQFTGMGWYIAAAIVAPTLLGVWVDGKVETAPLFLLAGLLLGVAAAFYGTYKMAFGFLTGTRDADADVEPDTDQDSNT
jgi:F0F1-type ATP synthase assembly protein I